MSDSTYDMDWPAPDGFHLYRNGGDQRAWIKGVLAETDVDRRNAKELKSSLKDFLARTAMNPNNALHVVGIGADAVGHQRVFAMGQIVLGELVEVEEVADRWRASIEEDAAGSFDVVVVPSRKSPAAAVRQVYKSQSQSGEIVYREWGSSVRNFKEMGLSVAFELVTSDLSAFDDMTQFLLNATESLTLEISEVQNG